MLFSIFDCGQSENHYISVEDTTSSKRAGFLLFLSFTSQENMLGQRRRSSRTGKAKSVYSPTGSALKRGAKKKPKVGNDDEEDVTERVAREALEWKAEETARLKALKAQKEKDAKEAEPATDKQDVGQDKENPGGGVTPAVPKDKVDEEAVAEDGGESPFSKAIAAAIKRGGDQGGLLQYLSDYTPESKRAERQQLSPGFLGKGGIPIENLGTPDGSVIDVELFSRALDGQFSKVIDPLLDALHETGLGGFAEGDGTSRENKVMLRNFSVGMMIHDVGRRDPLTNLDPGKWSLPVMVTDPERNVMLCLVRQCHRYLGVEAHSTQLAPSSGMVSLSALRNPINAIKDVPFYVTATDFKHGNKLTESELAMSQRVYEWFCGEMFSEMFVSAEHVRRRRLSIADKVDSFLGRQQWSTVWLTDQSLRWIIHRQAEHVYALYWNAHPALFMADFELLPHEALLYEAVGNVDAARRAAPGAVKQTGLDGSQPTADQDTAPPGSGRKTQKPDKGRSPVGQIVDGMKADTKNRLRKGVCIKYFLGTCTLPGSHATKGIKGTQFTHQCLVSSCELKHRAKDSATCSAVVEQVRLLGVKS